MFSTILIANRGEIACRIIKTAQEMGIKTIAIYSSADVNSLHVKKADEAYWVGEAPAKDSYLNIDAIIAIAKKSGAQAIHPGYGFLSENPKFAKACAKADITFIGPDVKALEIMASKQVAKQLLEKSKVPLTPGYHGSEQSESRLLKEAKAIGFPVLLKAANGGGGKGMRTVENETDFSDALAGAKRESQASFADDTMIIEKLVRHPRHIEVQIMADNHGNVVAVFERSCSIQRRHQKIIEEAPAPNLSAALRKKLADAACEVAKSIQYRGAGTVEFLVDNTGNFYFMEMNTRLQVEHPVTEMVTGIDLVNWQLHIAAGNPLPLTQNEIPLHGHAIECRIYAEDPLNNFIPSIGQLDFLQEPSGEGVRIDTGVTVDSTISMYYDPMIAKLICHGKDREEALHRMQQALNHYYISGVKTNIPFLQAILEHKRFIDAKLSTDFLDTETIHINEPDPFVALLMAISFDYITAYNAITDPLQKDTFAWQIAGKNHWHQRYFYDNDMLQATISPITDNQFSVQVLKEKLVISASIAQNTMTITAHNQQYKATIHNTADKIIIFNEQGRISIARYRFNKAATQATQKGQLTAPMPATVVAILKKIGDAVKAGDKLIVLEAMKMEHTIHAPADGVLKDIFYPVGSQVNEGAELLTLSATDA